VLDEVEHGPAGLKEIRRRGDSREVAHDFPKGARLKLGKELTRIQMGMLCTCCMRFTKSPRPEKPHRGRNWISQRDDIES